MNSIEEMTLIGVGQRLLKAFDLPSQPVEMPTNDRVHLWQQMAQKEGRKLEYPLMAYSLTGVQPSDTASVSAVLFRPIATMVRDDTIGALSVVPVIFTIGVTYIDNDRVRLLRTMAAWMFARGRGTLNMRLRVDGIPIDIQVTPDADLSAPQKDMTLDSPGQYELEGTLTVRGWMSGDFGESIVRITRVSELTTSISSSDLDKLPPDLTGKEQATPSPQVVEEAIANFNQDDVQAHLLYSVTTRLGEANG